MSGIGKCSDHFRFQRIIPGLDALRTVEGVEYLRFDTGPFLILFSNRLWIFADQSVAFQGGTQIGNHDLGIFLGKVRTDLNTVRGCHPGAFAVENLSGKSPEGKKFTERHEIRMRIDLSGFQCRTSDLRGLSDDPHILIGIPSLVLDRAEQECVGGRGERHGDRLSLEIRDALNGRIQRHQECVAGATKAQRERCDVERLDAIVLREKSVVSEDGRKIGHRDYIESAGEDFIIELGTGRKIDPMDVVSGVFIFAIVWQVFVQQLKFANDRATRRAVYGGILRSNAQLDHFLPARDLAQA